MQNSFDANGDNRGSHEGRKQNSPKRIANGLPEASLERLRIKLPVRRGQSFFFHLQLLGFDQIRPMSVRCRHSVSHDSKNYFEYSSTISFSFIGMVMSLRLGRTFILPLKFSRSRSAHSGTPRRCAPSIAESTRAIWRLCSFTDTTSPTRTRQEGIFTLLPFTNMCPCRTKDLASARELAKPSR